MFQILTPGTTPEKFADFSTLSESVQALILSEDRTEVRPGAAQMWTRHVKLLLDKLEDKSVDDQISCYRVSRNLLSKS